MTGREHRITVAGQRHKIAELEVDPVGGAWVNIGQIAVVDGDQKVGADRDVTFSGGGELDNGTTFS
ncbi:MAG: hypothetical protein VXX01_01345, partial [Pseudomonadota bacterium]|nr:hypothetical protein [Pseudomonadota bacterium]